jgi:sulfopyruvate decarboxylase TPP-binding subunit
MENMAMMTKILIKNNFVHGSGVPCSILKKEIAEIEDSNEIFYIPAVDEGVALGLVNGFMLAGNKAFLLTQNSAVGRVSDLVMSFNMPYNFPLFWIVSMRGYEGDTAVHRSSYVSSTRILNSCGFNVWGSYGSGGKINWKGFEDAIEFYQDTKKNTAFLRYKHD